MGIQNLLGFMKPFIEQINIKKFAGKRVGIDAYSWLHKGAYSCSLEICMDLASDKKLRYLQYFMHRINLLRHYNVIPVVVFDGGNIPCKSATEDERHRRRDANLALAKEKLNQGNSSAAIEFFQKAVSITPTMAHQLIQILRSEDVEFIVAPYEADAQLAYLSSLEAEGGIAAVITEDSDLLAYGCKAIVFKMDRYGNGDEIILDKVFNSVPGPGLPGKNSKPPMAGAPTFNKFTKELFTGMCVLAGCDFLPSVTGIGIKRAYSMVSKYRNLDRVLSVLMFEKGNQMPEDYAKSFKEAVAVFHHAQVFDTGTKTIKPLKPLPEVLLQSLDEDLDFLGPEIPSSMATAIAEGHLNPITMEAFDHQPKVEAHLYPVITQSSNHFSRPKTQVISTEESCCTTFSSCITREENIKAVEEKKPNLDAKYLKEAIALQTLMVPLEAHQKSSDIVERKEFPCNNPFRKRKLDDISLDQEQNTTEQVSVVTVEEKSEEILFSTPGSQESVTSKAREKIVVHKALKKNVMKLKNKNSCRSSERSSNSSILKFFKPL